MTRTTRIFFNAIWGMCFLVLLASTTHPARAEATFDKQVAATRALCERAASTACAKATHKVLDLDGNGTVSFVEIEYIRAAAMASVQDRKSLLNPEERTIFGLALIGLKSAGAREVFANFDTNRDAKLDVEELFADVRLDQRPMAAVTADENAVNWPGLAGRFGKLGQSLIQLLPAKTAQ